MPSSPASSASLPGAPSRRRRIRRSAPSRRAPPRRDLRRAAPETLRSRGGRGDPRGRPLAPLGARLERARDALRDVARGVRERRATLRLAPQTRRVVATFLRRASVRRILAARSALGAVPRSRRVHRGSHHFIHRAPRRARDRPCDPPRVGQRRARVAREIADHLSLLLHEALEIRRAVVDSQAARVLHRGLDVARRLGDLRAPLDDPRHASGRARRREASVGRGSGAAPRSKLARGASAAVERVERWTARGARGARPPRPSRHSSRATTHPATRRVPPLRSRPGRSWRSPPREDPPGRKTIPRRRSILPRTRRARVSLRRVVSATRLGRALGAVRTRRRGGHLGRAARVRWVSERAYRLARLGATEKRSHTRVFEKECPAVPIFTPKAKVPECHRVKKKIGPDFFDTPQAGSSSERRKRREPKTQKSPLRTSCLSLYSARANRSRRSDSKHG